MLCYETFNDTAFIFQTDKGIWQPSEGTPDGLGSGAETAAGDLFIVLLILILVVETESEEENEILKRQTSKWASMMSVLRTLLLLLMICLAVVTSSVAGERLQLLVVHIMIIYDGPMTCYEPVWLGEMWSCARTWRGRATTFEDAPVIIRRFLNKCRPLIVNFRARMFSWLSDTGIIFVVLHCSRSSRRVVKYSESDSYRVLAPFHWRNVSFTSTKPTLT